MTETNARRASSGTRFRELVAAFQQRGYRMTPQRIALLRLLAASEGHPSASQLLARMSDHFPTTSPATVYKTLAVLRDMGEVLEIAFNDYDNRYDGNRPYPHPHLICVRCHEAIDATADRLEDLCDQVKDLYAEQDGYRAISHRVDLLGVCPACQDAGDGQRTAPSVAVGEDAD